MAPMKFCYEISILGGDSKVRLDENTNLRMLKKRIYNEELRLFLAKEEEFFEPLLRAPVRKPERHEITVLPFQKFNRILLHSEMTCLQEEDSTLARDVLQCTPTLYFSSTDGIDYTKDRPIRIPKPEFRGITLSQLKSVATQIVLRSTKEGWKSANSREENDVLRPEQVTLYDLVENFIIPLTEPHKCSYVELVAEEAQPPKWFVSHWWGEPVLDFIACIGQHALDHGLGDDTSYWVCAYALNQHKLGIDLGQDLLEAPFRKAMSLADGVVSVLDSSCVSLERIWCCYEISLATKGLQSFENQSKTEDIEVFWDLYTYIKGRGAIGLTDGGYVAADKHYYCSDGSLNSTQPTKYPQFRALIRQQYFPKEICYKAMEIRLERASASRPSDKNLILNSICGHSTTSDSDPPTFHKSYKKLNSHLWGRFAVLLLSFQSSANESSAELSESQ